MAAEAFESKVLLELQALREASMRMEEQLSGLSAMHRDEPPGDFDKISTVGGFSRRSERRRTPHVLRIDASSRSLASSSKCPEMRSANSDDSQAVMTPNTQRFVASSLPLGWPKTLKMRTELSEDEVQMPSAIRRFTNNNMSSARCLQESEEEELQQASMRASRFAMNPNSRFHMIYSCASLIVLFFDLTVLPYVLAWEVEFTGMLYVTAWITPVFWSFDIAINFFTGIYKDGEVSLNLEDIARAYCRCWFFPDAVVVLCDWLSLILGEILESGDTSRSLKMLRFSKMGRLLRIVGVMRMLRVVRIMEEFAAVYITEGYRLMFRMVNLTISILWTAHLLACFWYAVGRGAPSDTGGRWTELTSVKTVDGPLEYGDSSPVYQYMVAFHWAAGQIALGSIDVTPSNSVERIVFVLTMMIGFLFGSTLVSMLSAAMMDYQMMQKDMTLKLRMLRQYLRENEVPAGIAVLVQRQVEQRLQERERLDENDVVALSVLSAALRSQLRFEIQRPDLSRHPVFRLWIGMDTKLMHRTCMKAVSFLYLRPRDDLFAPGATAQSAYALVKGCLSYAQSPDSSPVSDEVCTAVEPGKWLCEAALWVEWTHVGRAESTMACQMLEIGASSLSQCLQQDFIIKEVAVEYCRQFHKRVRAAYPPHAPWPTDLEIPFTDYCNLVVSMSKQVQVAIGRDAVNQLSMQRGARAIEQLRQEVDSSKSIVVVTGTGAIIRVVSLVVLRATQPSGHVFMQVGKYDGSSVKSALQLPGVKQEADELVSETLERIFATKLTMLEGKLEFLGITQEDQEKESKEFGVQTRYLRSICAARLPAGKKLDAHVCTEKPKEVESEAVFCEEVMRQSTSSGALMHHLLRALKEIIVYAVPSGDRSGNLYAWVPADRLGILGSSNGEKILRTWLSNLEMPAQSVSEQPDTNNEGDVDLECHLSIVL